MEEVMRRACAGGGLVLLTLSILLTSSGGWTQIRPTDSQGTHMAWMELAKTPPMGWNSWNKFGCNVSDQLIRETADAMLTSGMKDAGYEYVVIDDCWQVARDDQGNIMPDAKRFPSGMKSLADYIHSKGLKFGLYSDAGARTCQRRPASSGYEVEDARQYAAWGVDYLKYDWCYTDGVDPKIAYPTMRDALRATGRPIIFSICEWGKSSPWTWARGVGHLWRTTEDIQDCFSCLRDWGGAGWTSTQGPGGGTIPTCWKWGTEDSPPRRAGLISASGVCWPRR
jgi:alpha-galactosidase